MMDKDLLVLDILFGILLFLAITVFVLKILMIIR